MTDLVFQASCPGKTFLVGEYIALEGGPCVIAATEKRFTFKIALEKSLNVNGVTDFTDLFHPESPAGLYLNKNKSVIQKFCDSFQEGQPVFSFSDPYGKAIGLGRSTAEFLLSYLFVSSLKSNSVDLAVDYKILLEEYIQLIRPSKASGADLMAQFKGGLCQFHKNQNELKNLNWKFKDLGFFIVSTGRKVQTHEHLNSEIKIPFETLKKSALLVEKSLNVVSRESLIRGVNEYQNSLTENNLTCFESLELISRIQQQIPEVLAVKGCGALGADTLFVLFNLKDQQTVKDVLHGPLNLVVRADQADLSDGARVERFKSYV